MVRHASLFSQLIALFDRKKFHELVYHHNAERFAKKFNLWDRFLRTPVLPISPPPPGFRMSPGWIWISMIMFFLRFRVSRVSA